MKCDDNVHISDLKYVMRKVPYYIEKIYKDHGQELFITGTTNSVDEDGNIIHSSKSKHPFGYAFDVRTKFWKYQEQLAVYREIKEMLGIAFKVIFHSTHIHIEFNLL